LIQDHATAESDLFARCVDMHDMKRPFSVLPLRAPGARYRSAATSDKAGLNAFVSRSIETDG